MNRYVIVDDYRIMDTNPRNDVQVIENKDISSKATQIVDTHSIMNIKDGVINDVPTTIEKVNNDDQSMS